MTEEAKPATPAFKAIAPFFLGPIAAPLIAYQAWSTGYILTRLWTWYALPLGLPPVAGKVFCAFWLGRRVLRGFFSENEPVDSRTPRERYVQSLLSWAGPWLILLVGWWLR